MSNRQKDKKQKRGLLFWFVFLLAVSVIATSILTTMLMNKYYFDASGAIDISPNNPSAQQQQPSDDGQSNNDNGNDDKVVPSATPRNPGFQASNHTIIWGTDTRVDIFKSTYFNKQGQQSVKSDNGDMVIAPGTGNSFVFKLANTGNVPLDFTLDIDAYITPDGYELPVRVRLHRYDNTWLLGNKDEWMFVPHLNEAGDSGTMGAGKYFYYTLDWEWPFESDSNYDTYLGDKAVSEDISLTIVIKTSAAESADKNVDTGITIPDTGDASSLVLWGTVATISLVACTGIIIFIILLKRREEDEEDSATEDTQIEEDKKS